MNMLPHTTLASTIIEILTHGPSSLATLQASTQVSMPTLRRAVQSLLEEKWLSIAEGTTATRGRPAMLFGLNEAAHIIIGAHLQLPGLRLLMVNFTGDVLDEAAIHSEEVMSPESVLQEIAKYTDRARQDFPDRRVLGVGIASPGFTDAHTGEILSIGRVPGWQSFPIRSRIKAATGLTAMLVNDVDCMAYAEILRADNGAVDSQIYVGFDEGIKASIFLNGKLYTGSFGNAGIIGRTRIGTRDEGFKSLENLVSIRAIVEGFRQEVSQAGGETDARYNQILSTGDARQQFQYILEAAQSETDGLCRSMVDDMLELLALAIANTIYVIQPELLIVGGALSTLPVSLFSRLEAEIRQLLPQLLSNQLIIQQAQLASPSSVPIGITRQFLRHFITTPDFRSTPAPAAESS